MPSANNIRIAKNTMYMYLRMFAILIVSLYTTRIVFNVLGVHDFGIYNVVGGVIVFFTFINSSLAGATQRYITAELAEGTIETQREIFSAAIISHLIIGLVIVFFWRNHWIMVFKFNNEYPRGENGRGKHSLSIIDFYHICINLTDAI